MTLFGAVQLVLCLLWIVPDATHAHNSSNSSNITQSKYTVHMVGGIDTPAKGVLVGLRLSQTGENFCLGALIARNFVLTAAHCVHQVQPEWVSVGSLYSSSDVDGEQIRVNQTTIHLQYDSETFRNDLALVEMRYISIQTPIALYPSTDIPGGEKLRLYGFEPGGPDPAQPPRKQQHADLPTVAHKTYKAVLKPQALDASMLCAGGEKQINSCTGDSGGPLVTEQEGHAPLLIGLSSFGRGCGLEGIPAVYSVVSSARTFIDTYVKKTRWG